MCITIGVGYAQRKQVVRDYHKGAVEAIPNSQMPGKITYSYVVDEEGNNLKDGALSIKCGLTNYKFVLSPYTIVLNGSFVVNTNYSKGNLNGAFSAYYKLNGTGTTIFGTSKDGNSSSMTGNFTNGVPNGAFKITRNGEIKTTVVANYKNGDLVGAYNCSLFDDDSRLVKYSGSLSQSGKMVGTWNLNGINAQFQNGVLISQSTQDKSTPPPL